MKKSKLEDMDDQSLNSDLKEYKKDLKNINYPIDEYEDLYGSFKKDSKKLIQIHSEFSNSLNKLQKIQKNSTGETKVFGFKIGEYDKIDYELSGSVSLWDDVNKLKIEYLRYRNNTINNRIVVSQGNHPLYKKSNSWHSYYVPYTDENEIKFSEELTRAIDFSHDYVYSHWNEGSQTHKLMENLKIDFSNGYILKKSGAKIVAEYQSKIIINRIRKIELILRSRKRKKDLSTELNSIYVLSNKSYPKNTFKIGWTSSLPEERAEQLSGETGVLYPFKVEYSKKFKDAEKIEKKIHKHFDEYRIRKNKEYFEIEIEKIIKFIEKLSSK